MNSIQSFFIIILDDTMIKLYKKVERTRENPSGVIEITSPNELNKPFLLCMSAQDSLDNSVFGVIKVGASAARVYTTEEDGLGFKIDDFPIDFIGIKFKKKSIEEEKYVELVDQYIFPLLVGNGNKTIDEIKRSAMNINVMTYCNGTAVYVRMEQYLKQRLSSIGISEQDIKEILKNISLIAIGTDVNTSELDSTTVKFVDVNDDEIRNGETGRYDEELDSRRSNSLIESKKSNVTYVYRGSGDHDLREYLSKGVMVKPVLCAVVAFLLQKSYKNSLGEDVSITLEELLEEMNEYSNEAFNPDRLMELLESRINYGDSPRYTKEGMELRRELDLSLKELNKTKNELDRKSKEKETFESKVRDLVEQIRECSSETTFYQILGRLHMWNMPDNFDDSAPTDKEIRAVYEEMIKSEKGLKK